MEIDCKVVVMVDEDDYNRTCLAGGEYKYQIDANPGKQKKKCNGQSEWRYYGQ